MLARDPLLKIPVLIRCLSYIAGISETMTLLAGERFALVNEIRKEGIKQGELVGGNAAGLALAYCCLIDQHINILVRQPNTQNQLTPKLAYWLVSIFFDGASKRSR
jgi:hypothetical protein